MKDIAIFSKMLYNIHIKVISITFLLCSLYFYRQKFNIFVFLPSFILIIMLLVIEIKRLYKESDKLDFLIKKENKNLIDEQSQKILSTSQEKSENIQSEQEKRISESLKNDYMKKRMFEILTTLVLTTFGFVNLSYILNCISKFENIDKSDSSDYTIDFMKFYLLGNNDVCKESLCKSCSHIQISIYFLSLVVFHQMEYLFVCKFHFSNLSWDSFLLNQSKEYVFTVSFSIVEYLVEWYFSVKFLNPIVFIVGIIFVLIGHYFRISAEFTAGTNFTHIISTNKKSKHRLVKEGVYKYSRHPSYFGFYIWSIGTQIMCFNFISILGFFYALNLFFKDRISYEEDYLIKFFENDYIEYKKVTPTLIPCKNHFKLK